MPRDGALTLYDIRNPTLSIVCEPCGRHGRYGVARRSGVIAASARRSGGRPRVAGWFRYARTSRRRAVVTPTIMDAATPPRAPLALGRPRLSGGEPTLQDLVLGLQGLDVGFEDMQKRQIVLADGRGVGRSCGHDHTPACGHQAIRLSGADCPLPCPASSR